ncbi:MAG: oligosaccharide flippase family protein [Bacteroidia bacterium]|jgi:O-antigen/teichoic acid export membrane protein|nr:oligosaccharide flippase family protein [Bacteroidia bacterium]
MPTFVPEMSSSNPIKTLAGQTMIYGLGTFVPRLLNYLLVPFYTRVFDEASYGQITELYAYVAFLMVLLTYGMETAFFRFAQKYPSQDVFNNAFTLLLSSTAIFFLIILLFGSQFAMLIGYGNTTYIVTIMLMIVAVDAVNALPFALLRKQQRPGRFTFLRITNVVVNIGLNLVFLVWFREHTTALTNQLFSPETGLVVWVFVSNLLASLLSTFMLMPLLKGFSLQWNKPLLREMLVYALPILVVGLAGMVNEVLDKILLKYLVAPEDFPMRQLGIYGANYKLGILMTLFVQMFRYASEPFFFAKAGEKKAPELFARVMHYFTITGFAIFLVVMLYIDLFKHFIGPAYREGLFIVPIILIANLFYGIYFNLSIWYKLTDRTHHGAVLALAGALITLLFNILLVPVMGYAGAAWATLICYVAMAVLSFIWGQKVYPVPYMVREFLFFLAISLLLYAISVWLAPEQLALRLLLNTLLMAIFALIALKSLRKSESAAHSSEIRQ